MNFRQRLDGHWADRRHDQQDCVQQVVAKHGVCRPERFRTLKLARVFYGWIVVAAAFVCGNIISALIIAGLTAAPSWARVRLRA